MKKRILPMVLAALLLLAACTAHDARQAESAPPAPEQADGETGLQSLAAPLPRFAANPYNTQTAVWEGYTFVVQKDAVYRVDAQGWQTLVSYETHGLYIGSAPNLAAIDGYLYFMARKAPDGAIALYRCDSEGEGLALVAGEGGPVRNLFAYEGNLVAVYQGAASQGDVYHEFWVYRPDGQAARLQEIPLSEFGPGIAQTLENYFYSYRLEQELYNQLGFYSEGDWNYSALFTDAGFTFFYTGPEGLALALVPTGETEAVTIPLSEEARQAMAWDGNGRAPLLVNYDDEWLYLRSIHRLFRIRRDGTEYQPCVPRGVLGGPGIDIVGGSAFFLTGNAVLYRADLTTGEVEALGRAGEIPPVELVVTSVEGGIAARPLQEEMVAELGEAVHLSLGNGMVELLDKDGFTVPIYAVEEGMLLCVYYTDQYVREAEGYTYLFAYRVVLLE